MKIVQLIPQVISTTCHFMKIVQNDDLRWKNNRLVFFMLSALMIQLGDDLVNVENYQTTIYQRLMLFQILGGEFVKLFLETLRKIRGTRKTDLQGDIQYRPGFPLQELSGPLQPVGADKLRWRLSA